MKKISTLMMMLFTASMSYAQVSVTINIDMTGSPFNAATEDLYYSGNMNEWADPGSDPTAKMNDIGDGIYQVVFSSVMPGYTWNDFYPIVKGTVAWPDIEWSGAPLGIDQMIYIGTENVTVNAKWGKVITAKLSVDMNGVAGFNPLTDTVYFMNEFVYLDATPLTKSDVSGIYTVTIDSLPQGINLATAFAYGSYDADNLTYETLPVLPGLIDLDHAYRMVYLAGADVNLSFVFGSELLGLSKPLGADKNVVIYPNPVTNKLLLTMPAGYKVVSVSIFNLNGKTVYTGQMNSVKGSINVNSLSPGIYTIRISNGTEMLNQKFIKK